MNRMKERLGSLCMAVVMLLSMAVTPAMATDTQDPPTEVTNCEVSGLMLETLNLNLNDEKWLNAITKVVVNDAQYEKAELSWTNDGNIWNIGSVTGSYGSYQALKIVTKFSFPATIMISAAGYKDLKVQVTKDASTYPYVYTAAAEVVGGSDSGDSGNGGSGGETPDTTKKNPPAVLTYCEQGGYPSYFNIGFGTLNSGWDQEWVDKVTTVKNGDTAVSFSRGNYIGGYGTYYALQIKASEIKEFPATMVISADGYKDLTLEITKEKSGYNEYYVAKIKDNTTIDPSKDTYDVNVETATNGTVTVSSTSAKAGDTVTVTATPADGYELDTITVTDASGAAVAVNDSKFTMPAENVTVSAAFKVIPVTPPATGDKEISLSQVKLSQDSFERDWYVTFDEAGYVSKVSKVTVNGTEWEAKDYGVSSGGAYKKNTENNRLEFAAKDFSPNPTIPVLKSGDVIAITAAGYKDLTMKFVVDADGKASLVADDGQGDPLELHVKLVGSFEAAIVGQKDYDGVSSASTGGASSNKNSAVTVYGALVAKNTKPTNNDWEELDNMAQIKLEGKNCYVTIAPDTSVAGMTADKDSGMKGVYWTISSDLTLNGTPKDAGSYLISIHVEDDQGRTAGSNTLPFRIYTGEETLAEQIQTKNLKQYSNGLYAWDIMEPWAIKNFGSNVENETESVRVPKDLEVWYGSHESGTYGYLGYDLAWKEVEKGNIPQTLYIPNGCNLTLMNMKILSSVRIVVENGGKLTLRDSTVQGIIDVQSGGTFSMNYDSYKKAFETGASLCGQLRLADGAVLENAAIYSHTNYLANGNLTDRSNDEAVVLTTGNVTVKGQVFISGDEAGSTGEGQTALKVQNGTLTLEDGAVLATYGGGGNVTLPTTAPFPAAAR